MRNPLIGRPVSDDLRELVIGRGTRGYIALYRYVAALDMVFVLAIRGQTEAANERPRADARVRHFSSRARTSGCLQ